jgi:hypothetical protein
MPECDITYLRIETQVSSFRHSREKRSSATGMWRLRIEGRKSMRDCYTRPNWIPAFAGMTDLRVMLFMYDLLY